MSSWSASAYPPPPRRSRSRSPPRGAYPPRDDPAYPPADYRAEWDAYHRGRWDDYQRYEYSRRGRSRSPPADEPGRKRRRSMSPYERDRYDPRPRYGDDYDAHSRSYGYRSPGGRSQYPPPYPNRRAPPDPHSFDYQASLKQYADWFRYYYPQQAIEEDNLDKAAEQDAGDGSKPRNGIKAKWEKYKKDFAATQLQTMFDHHRKSPWFVEKYDLAPEFMNLRARTRRVGWKGRESSFLLDIEAGKFDPDFNEPMLEAEPISPVKENPANGESAVVMETNGSGVLTEEPKAAGGDDEMQFNMDAEEDGGDNAADNDTSRVEANGKPSGKNERFTRGEEISVPPEGNQVMIRTIPPDIGRVKLEDACGKLPGYMYLALGDPLQKRNFYRAGWLRFTDDADMALIMAELSEKKIEGFKLHVVHNLRPFVNRIRYTPEVASKPDRLEKDLANAKVLAGLLEEEAAALRKTKIASLSAKDPAIEGVEGENGQTERKEDVSMADDQVPSAGDDDDEPKERGSDAVERRIEKIMAEMRDQGLVDVNDEKAFQAKKTVVSLDLYLAYLRAAFHTCYYCAVVTDHLEELQRKCLKHVRKPLSKMLLEEVKAAEAEKAEKEKEVRDDDEHAEKDEKKEKESPVKERGGDNRDWKRNDERWLEWLDSKIALLIDRDRVDPRNYGGKHYDEELTKAVEPFIKQEDEGKFRCKTCQKLFKATSFVEKHIANKHPELVKHLDELPFYNNFALDPHRIQPFAHPPPAVGNSQGPPPQAYGIKGPVPGYAGDEYGRPGAYYGSSFSQAYPPSYTNGGHWDHYGFQYGGAYLPPPPPGRRDDGTTARRLSERISGYAPGFDQPLDTSMSAAAGLPAKPMASMASLEPGPGGRRGGRSGSGAGSGPPPPPPPDAKEDPRAAAGKKVSYHDMDLVAEGDVELTY